MGDGSGRKRVAGSIHSLDSPLIVMLALGRTGAAIGESTTRDQALPVISDSAATVAKVWSVQVLHGEVQSLRTWWNTGQREGRGLRIEARF